MIQWIWEENFECKNQDEITKLSLKRVVLILIKKKQKRILGSFLRYVLTKIHNTVLKNCARPDFANTLKLRFSSVFLEYY